MTRHLDNRPVSASTYRKHGCRCEECRAAANAHQREMRRRGRTALHLKADRKAATWAATWVRREHPEVWQKLRAEAQAEVGLTTDSGAK
jgi:hypothetical protein